MTEITPHLLRLIATRASVDPRTVQRLLDGHPVRPSGAARVREAMRRLGVTMR